MLKLVKRITRSETRIIFLLGVSFFAYSLCAGALIQSYLIPKVFPHFNLSDGLVVPDSTGFNMIAKAKSAEILEKGWDAWELRPQEYSPAGIASIFYSLWIPKPYSLLPFNALIHALSGCVIFWVLRHFFSLGPAILGAVLFVLNPTSLEWVAQIHRDGIFVLGNLLVLVCLMQLWQGLKSNELNANTRGLLYGVLGSALVWVARPYWVQVLAIVVFLCALLIGGVWLATKERRGAK